VAAQLHFAENSLALHLLLERFERLVDIVVTNENLHLVACSLVMVRTGHPVGVSERPVGVTGGGGPIS
jgi:hypothetical protein